MEKPEDTKPYMMEKPEDTKPYMAKPEDNILNMEKPDDTKPYMAKPEDYNILDMAKAKDTKLNMPKPGDEPISTSVSSRIMSFLKCIWSNITIEPSILFFVLAYGMDIAPTNTLWLHKICRVKMQLSPEICSNYSGTPYENQIQKWDTTYTTYANYINSFPGAVFTAFLGAWCDKYGRRFPLVMAPLGYVMYFVGCILSVYFESSPDYFLISYACIGMFGGMGSLIIGCLSYISEVSTGENRTVRLAIVEATMFLGIMLGNVIGPQIFKHGGYYAIYGVTATCALLSSTYSLFFVKECREVKVVPLGKKIIDFFDLRNLREAFRTTFRKRINNGRLKVIATIVTLATYVLVLFGENYINFMFVNHQFQWDASDYSLYNAFSTLTIGLPLIVTLPILAKILKLGDATLGILASSLRFANALVTVFATKGWMMYFGASINLFAGGISLPIRAIASKAVPTEEVGKVFAMLGCLECLVPLLSTTIYTNLFKATLDYFPQSCFVLTASLCFFIFCIFVLIYIIDAKSSVTADDDPKETPKNNYYSQMSTESTATAISSTCSINSTNYLINP